MREMALGLAASFFFCRYVHIEPVYGTSWRELDVELVTSFFLYGSAVVCHSSCPPQSRSGLARHEAPSMDMDRLGDGRFRLFRRPSLRIGWRESGENEHLYRCNEEV